MSSSSDKNNDKKSREKARQKIRLKKLKQDKIIITKIFKLIDPVEFRASEKKQKSILKKIQQLILGLNNKKRLDTIKDKFGNTVFVLIAAKGLNIIVKFLLDFGVNLNIVSFDNETALLAAINNNYPDTVDILLSHGANIEPSNPEMTPPLTMAVMVSRLDIVKMLVSRGANINVDPKDGTPLYIAVNDEDNGNFEIAKYLLENGADPNLGGPEKKYPLSAAFEHKNIEMIKLLLKFDANPARNGRNYNNLLKFAVNSDDVELVELLARSYSKVDSRLISRDLVSWAVPDGKLEIVRTLVDLGLPINIFAPQGGTPLYGAVHDDNFEMAEFLLQRGADPNLINKYNKYPIMVAIKNGNLEMVQLLVAHGAIVNILKHSQSPLAYATEYFELDIMTFLLENGADPNFVDEERNYAISSIVTSDEYETEDQRIEIIKLFMKHGANLSILDSSELCPLIFYAIRFKKKKIVEFLLQQGVDPNLGIRFESNGEVEAGYIPIIECVIENDIDSMKLLISYGAEVDATNLFYENETALIRSAKKGRHDMIELLIDHGANVNTVNIQEQSAITFAVKNEAFYTVEYLMDKGADINVGQSTGMTPLFYAVRRGYLEAVEVVLSYDPNVNTLTKRGRNLLFYVGKKESLEIMELLLLKGVDPNVRDNNGMGMLEFLISRIIRNRIARIQLLINFGLKYNYVNIQDLEMDDDTREFLHRHEHDLSLKSACIRTLVDSEFSTAGLPVSFWSFL